MSLRTALFWMTTASVSFLAVGARVYKYMYSQETQQESAFANQLLRQTLQSAHTALSNPNSNEIYTALGTAGIGILNAYLSSVSHANHRPHALQVPVQPGQVQIANTYEKRLVDSGYDLNNLPEEFCDPITFNLMNDPVIAYTTLKNNRGETIKTPHVYDRATYNQFRGICPENRQPFMECKAHDELRNRINEFVNQQTQRQNRAPT